MDILKNLGDAASFLAAYPTWVKVLVAVTILMITASAFALLYSPKTIPVEKWLLASDDTTIKAVIPNEMFDEWETKKHIVDDLTERLPTGVVPQVPQEMLQDVETKKQRLDDLTHQREELAAQQLGYGKNPPSPSADIGKLSLEMQRAQRELNEAQAQVNKYIDPKAEKAQNELSHAQNERQQAITKRNETQARIEQYIARELLATRKFIARGIPNEAPPHDNEQVIIKPAQWQYHDFLFPLLMRWMTKERCTRA